MSAGVIGSFFTQNPINVLHPSIAQPNETKEISVARYGRIYKRKSNSSCIAYMPTPCQPGFRFCKICNCSLPLEAFYTRIKRYVCRRHHYERVRKAFMQRAAAKNGQAFINAERAW